MYRMVLLLICGLLAGGCMQDAFSQSGAAYSSCSGIINIGCNATTRNVILPSSDEALALAGALAGVSVFLCVIYLAKKANSTGHDYDG